MRRSETAATANLRYPRNPRFLLRHCDFGFHRVSDETLVVREMMHFVQLFGSWLLVAGKLQFRMQLDSRDGQSSFRILLHVTDCVVTVFLEHKLLLTGNREKREHVTTGKRSNERFLWIYVLRVP